MNTTEIKLPRLTTHWFVIKTICCFEIPNYTLNKIQTMYASSEWNCMIVPDWVSGFSAKIQ